MKILLTNDDGIDAPGISALWDAVNLALLDRETEIIVVAPDRGRSECSHSVTSGPFRLQEVKPGWFSVDGTPADCVRVALHTLMPEPMVVFSGINAGANLGVNLTVSGTFAAAREAAIHEVSAMAISHYRRPDVARTWDHAPRWTEATIREFVSRCESVSETQLWNVNLPAIDPDSSTPNVVRCEVDRCPIERHANRDGDVVSFELDFHGRPRESGTDVDVCFAGSVTISELSPHQSAPHHSTQHPSTR